MSSRSLWIPGLAIVATVFAVTTCGGGARQESEVIAAPPGWGDALPGGQPLVVGRTLDAATGRPIEASLRAPDGTEAHSDGEGRFVLRLAEGTAGMLEAETADGRRGHVVLRPLRGGRLEVVLHLRRSSW